MSKESAGYGQHLKNGAIRGIPGYRECEPYTGRPSVFRGRESSRNGSFNIAMREVRREPLTYVVELLAPAHFVFLFACGRESNLPA